MGPPTVIAPTHDLALGNGAAPRIESVVFAPDGRLYSEIDDVWLNVWNLLVFYWPEVLGGILFLLLLALTLPLVRVLRRPRVVGARHCRRCNYNMSDTPAGRVCPECGTDPDRKRPIIGRTRPRRLMVPGAIALVASVGYASLHLFRVGRDNRAKHLLNWDSPWLVRYAQDRNIGWLKRRAGFGRSLVEIEPLSGRILRTVLHLGRIAPFRLSISPDGRFGITTLSRGELGAIDLGSGRVVRTLVDVDGGARPDYQYTGFHWRHVVGWLGATTVCVQYFDARAIPDGHHEVYRWDFRSGDLKRLASIPIPDQSTAQTTLSSLSRLYILTGTEPPMACEVQDPLGRGLTYGRSSTIRVLDLSDNGRIVSEMTGGFWGGVAPVFLPDNSTFFIRMWGGESDIGLWSLKDGSFVGGLAAPGFMGTLQDGPAGLAYHGPSHRLFVATCDEVVNVHVRDTASKKWIATLSTDFRGLPDSQIALSPDGRWVAIKVVKLTPKGGGQRGSTGQDRLLIFDLAGMNAVEKAAPDPDSP